MWAIPVLNGNANIDCYYYYYIMMTASAAAYRATVSVFHCFVNTQAEPMIWTQCRVSHKKRTLLNSTVVRI